MKHHIYIPYPYHQVSRHVSELVQTASHESGTSPKALILIVVGAIAFTTIAGFVRSMLWGYSRARKGGYRSNYRAELARDRAKVKVKREQEEGKI
jgi:hypothetical protein